MSSLPYIVVKFSYTILARSCADLFNRYLKKKMGGKSYLNMSKNHWVTTQLIFCIFLYFLSKMCERKIKESYASKE